MIYIIHAVGSEFIKIGIATNPVRRMEAHQVSNPYKLVIVAIADWPDSYERRIHRVLAQHHVRGEWFMACDKSRSLEIAIRSGADPDAWLLSHRPPNRLIKALNIAK